MKGRFLVPKNLQGAAIQGHLSGPNYTYDIHLLKNYQEHKNNVQESFIMIQVTYLAHTIRNLWDNYFVQGLEYLCR